MTLNKKHIGFAFTGSFNYLNKAITELKKIKRMNTDVFPIMSYNSYTLDTKFGKAIDYIKEIEEITDKKVIHNIREAEHFFSKHILDILIVAPCSENTISKLSYDIVDTPVTIAVKMHLRNNKPVVIALSSNNGLSSNAENIGRLLNRKNYFFVPFKQTNPITKPYSIAFDSLYIIKTLEYALDNEQVQPLLL